jgi:hypothetical protein
MPRHGDGQPRRTIKSGDKKIARLMKSRAKSGAAVGSRTPNLLIRSQMLYPIELRLRRGTVNKAVCRAQCKRFFMRFFSPSTAAKKCASRCGLPLESCAGERLLAKLAALLRLSTFKSIND